ncbi:glutamate-rich WD repeat-containing protein 1 isoform X1 [Patella vulgata]|uniref:glutamate-rich WD repeat-containing protein 1 isoform X1 n=2 Tax=Patella vulgata TaxID=6465 RepID=UPI00217F5996|nr:glutamate-rich WD repeat-containing protein 1 isoform X1 [Patella vulgata]XP_055954418.1 glutamate-rich WD repeat-containing protein 1 isoform X1 [Patella vulgata]
MASESEDDVEMGEEDSVKTNKNDTVYLPGKSMDEGEQLVCDESTYIMYHQAQTDAPCLSFDILHDHLGENREDFPHTCYVAAGSQTDKTYSNHVIVMKMSNLCKTQKEGSDDEDDDESDDDDELPELETAIIKHDGCVNRIRATFLGEKNVAATWSEKGKVFIWDLSRPVNAVNSSEVMTEYTKNCESPAPIHVFEGHADEGYALDWSQKSPGRLLSGDCKKNIHLWTPNSSGWSVSQQSFVGHTASVEDIQWSPNEDNVFASCSVDKSIRIWDTRAAPRKACMLTTSNAHDEDINVINWNGNEPFIVSGGDDGVIKIWDLRQFQTGQPAALFKHHTSPVTSVEWHPTDSSVFAVAGEDDQLSLWDLSVERDAEASGAEKAEPDVPPQLLFIHQGQSEIKELHWHSQIPGVIISTAISGFNIFRTISV